jgi:hypothetical protein
MSHVYLASEDPSKMNRLQIKEKMKKMKKMKKMEKNGKEEKSA